MKTILREHMTSIGLLAIILIASLNFFLSTHKGLGIMVDSRIYYEGASNIQKSGKFRVFNNKTGDKYRPEKWPYGTSLILSAFGKSDIKYLYLIVYFVNILLFFILVFNLSSDNIISLLLTLYFVVQKDIAAVHFQLVSEPFYLLTTFLSFIYILNHFKNYERTSNTFAAISLVTFSISFRFAGIFTLIGYLIFLSRKLFFSFFERSKTRKKIFTFLVLTYCGFLSLIINNGFEIAGRTFFLYSQWYNKVLPFINRIFSWLNPYFTNNSFYNIVKSVVLIFIISLTYKIYSSVKVQTDKNLLFFSIVSLTFIFCYINHMFFLDPTVLADRTMMPLCVLVLILIACSINHIKKNDLPIFYSTGLYFLLVFGLVSNSIYAKTITKYNYIHGINLNSVKYQSSQTFNYLKNIKKGSIIYSNEPTACYFHSNKTAYRIPSKRDFITNKINPEYVDEVLKIKPETYVVIFEAYERKRKRWLISLDELMAYKGLVILFSDDLATIYQVTENANSHEY